nr:unnamed protein product [Callosobruchus analis]
MVYYHVFNLHPSVNQDNIEKYLKPRFPEVRCERLESRRPEEYSSFKVGILEKNSASFLDSKIWATGTKINKFFYPRRKPQGRL